MSDFSRLVRALRNVSVRKYISALERDGFVMAQGTIGSHRVYEHLDGRWASIAYHKGSATLTVTARKHLLRGTEWNAEDAVRLKLLKVLP